MSKRDRLNNLLNKKESPHAANIETQSSITTAIQEFAYTETQETVLTEKQKPVKIKKATFDFDLSFHTELKIFAAQQGKAMVDVVEEAVRIYMGQKTGER